MGGLNSSNGKWIISPVGFVVSVTLADFDFWWGGGGGEGGGYFTGGVCSSHSTGISTNLHPAQAQIQCLC